MPLGKKIEKLEEVAAPGTVVPSTHRAWTSRCCRLGGGTHLWDPAHRLGWLGSLLVSALPTAAPTQSAGVQSARVRGLPGGGNDGEQSGREEA